MSVMNFELNVEGKNDSLTKFRQNRKIRVILV